MEKKIVKLDSFNGLGIALFGRKGHRDNPDVFDYSIVVDKVNFFIFNNLIHVIKYIIWQ